MFPNGSKLMLLHSTAKANGIYVIGTGVHTFVCETYEPSTKHNIYRGHPQFLQFLKPLSVLTPSLMVLHS